MSLDGTEEFHVGTPFLPSYYNILMHRKAFEYINLIQELFYIHYTQAVIPFLVLIFRISHYDVFRYADIVQFFLAVGHHCRNENN